jgi:hypothetical protein
MAVGPFVPGQEIACIMLLMVVDSAFSPYGPEPWSPLRNIVHEEKYDGVLWTSGTQKELQPVHAVIMEDVNLAPRSYHAIGDTLGSKTSFGWNLAWFRENLVPLRHLHASVHASIICDKMKFENELYWQDPDFEWHPHFWLEHVRYTRWNSEPQSLRNFFVAPLIFLNYWLAISGFGTDGYNVDEPFTRRKRRAWKEKVIIHSTVAGTPSPDSVARMKKFENTYSSVHRSINNYILRDLGMKRKQPCMHTPKGKRKS